MLYLRLLVALAFVLSPLVASGIVIFGPEAFFSL